MRYCVSVLVLIGMFCGSATAQSFGVKLSAKDVSDIKTEYSQCVNLLASNNPDADKKKICYYYVRAYEGGHEVGYMAGRIGTPVFRGPGFYNDADRPRWNSYEVPDYSSSVLYRSLTDGSVKSLKQSEFEALQGKDVKIEILANQQLMVVGE